MSFHKRFICYLLSSFPGFIKESSDVFLVELHAIHKESSFGQDMDIDKLLCYSDSLHCDILIEGPNVRYHIHAVLIQEIKDFLSNSNVSVCHTL